MYIYLMVYILFLFFFFGIFFLKPTYCFLLVQHACVNNLNTCQGQYSWDAGLQIKCFKLLKAQLRADKKKITCGRGCFHTARVNGSFCLGERRNQFFGRQHCPTILRPLASSYPEQSSELSSGIDAVWTLDLQNTGCRHFKEQSSSRKKWRIG